MGSVYWAGFGSTAQHRTSAAELVGTALGEDIAVSVMGAEEQQLTAGGCWSQKQPSVGRV